MTNQYDDIINLPHFVSKKHSRMSNYDRAAQFAPFSALSGHKESIEETARITDKRPIVDESQKDILDFKLNYIMDHLKSSPEIELTYFKEDSKKSGGCIKCVVGKLMKVDLYKNIIIIDHKKISINDILDIKGDIFSDFEYF